MIAVDAEAERAHTDGKEVIREVSAMGLVVRMAPFWTCDSCKAEWYADTYKGPRQCPKCGSRGWNDGMVKDADLYARSVRWVVLNPYRKPLSVKQQESLRQRVAARRAAATPKAVRTPR